VLAATALIGQVPASAQDPLDRVNHIIVIYQENWSFDALYGKFPGANGFANADPVAIQQVAKDNRPYPTLPQPINRRLTPPAVGRSLAVRRCGAMRRPSNARSSVRMAS